MSVFVGRKEKVPAVNSPDAGTRVCTELLLPPPSSLCCVFAGPACQTPTEGEQGGEHGVKRRIIIEHNIQFK